MRAARARLWSVAGCAALLLPWQPLAARAYRQHCYIVLSGVTRKATVKVLFADEQHRTAIVRGALSRPARLAAEAAIISPGNTLFDYGCGRGEDVSILGTGAVSVSGWDPYYRPATPKASAQVVNLGYVVNVITDPLQRRDALLEAWGLAERALIVSARLVHELRTLKDPVPYSDGHLTCRGTFQKFYTPRQLQDWVESTLGRGSVVLGAGVLAVFKPPPGAGHAPAAGRRPAAADLAAGVARLRLDAMAGMVTRPRTGNGPDTPDSQQPGRFVPFAYPYADVAADAERLLDEISDPDALQAAAGVATVGKRLPAALYVHRSALDRLPGLLQGYERCARRVAADAGRGDTADAEVVKLATDEPRVSYLHYPGFDRDPHPALRHTLWVRVADRSVGSRDYSTSLNPPVLHRKECFVAADHPLRAKFARLTAQEERLGLLADTRMIGYRRGWRNRLAAAGVELRGHQAMRTRGGPVRTR